MRSHGNGWSSMVGKQVVYGMHAGQSQWVGSMSVDVGAHPECELKTLITPSFRCAALCRIEPELVGLPGEHFYVTLRDVSGSLYMQMIGCTPWCPSFGRLSSEDKSPLISECFKTNEDLYIDNVLEGGFMSWAREVYPNTYLTQ